MKWLSHVETVERSRSRTHSAQTALVLLLRHDPQLPHSRLGFLHMMQEQDYQNCRVNICQEARIDLQKWNKVMTRNDIYDLKWYWNQAGGCPRMPKGPRLAPESPKICNDFMTHDNPWISLRCRLSQTLASKDLEQRDPTTLLAQTLVPTDPKWEIMEQKSSNIIPHIEILAKNLQPPSQTSQLLPDWHSTLRPSGAQTDCRL